MKLRGWTVLPPRAEMTRLSCYDVINSALSSFEQGLKTLASHIFPRTICHAAASSTSPRTVYTKPVILGQGVVAGSLLSLVAILDLLPSEQFASLLAVEDLVALELVENLLDPVQAENPGGSPGAGVQRQCCAFLHSRCLLGGSVHV